MKTFRTNGAIGALLDEYERVLKDLYKVTENISTEELITIVDPETKDPSCRSIQTILSHVIRAGYCYVIEIRNSLGEAIEYPTDLLYADIPKYHEELDKMFKQNEKLFEDYPNIELEENDSNKKIKVRWRQLYDVEQLMEHAIVHILRHRRQIERFLLKLRETA